MVAATPLYAGLLALLFIYLTMRVVGARTTHKVSVGDGGEKAVIKAMRVHSNCAEYVPIGILLLALAEFQGMPVWLVHVFGVVFTAGRLLPDMDVPGFNTQAIQRAHQADRPAIGYFDRSPATIQDDLTDAGFTQTTGLDEQHVEAAVARPQVQEILFGEDQLQTGPDTLFIVDDQDSRLQRRLSARPGT